MAHLISEISMISSGRDTMLLDTHLAHACTFEPIQKGTFYFLFSFSFLWRRRARTLLILNIISVRKRK